MDSPPQISVLQTAWQWWRYAAAYEGYFPATSRLFGVLWEFARDSTPERLRQRYGDADYDWDYRVNTTSGTVGWRERLLGELHSAYQPTDPTLFKEMMSSLNIDFQELTFIDVGSGKGRVLLMAADYPFRRILGIELLPALNGVAQENLNAYKSESQKCFALETICGDARELIFPAEPILLYLFNPLPEHALTEVMTNLDASLRQSPRLVYVLYHNPLLEHVLSESGFLRKIIGTHQYSAWSYEEAPR